MNSIEILKKMIEGCENVIKDVDEEEGAKWLAKEVKKDCKDVIRAIQLEQGRIA